MAKTIIQPLQADYNKTVSLCGNKYRCFSKKRFEAIRGESYRFVGETKKNNDSASFARFASPESKLKVSAYRTHNRAFNKEAGYVLVGQDEYLVLLKHRALIPILILLAAECALLLTLLNKPDKGTEINNNQTIVMPVTDSKQEEITEDIPETPNNVKGDGGSVDLTWSNKVRLVKGTDQLVMLVQNPKSSTHSCKFSLYLETVEGEDDILIAESGAVQPGYQLREMTLTGDISNLEAGTYSAYYMIAFYDGELSATLVQSELRDIEFEILDN